MGQKSGQHYNAPPGSTQARRAIQRQVAFATQLPDSVVDLGRNWYPAVHEAAVKGGRELEIGTSRAAGIVAAVSPNMDFESYNIHALTEIGGLRDEHWDLIHRSNEQPRVPTSSGSGTKTARRLSETSDMLTEVAPSLSRATDRSLVQAHAILRGGQWRDVFYSPDGKRPKIRRFAANIENPDDPYPVTIDGRMADMVADRYRPWQAGRGIDTADLRSGKPTRYEHHEDIIRRASHVASTVDPRFHGVHGSSMQAILWEGAKIHERAWPTVSGLPRQQGAFRQGQRYSDEPRPGWLATPDAPQ